MRVRNLEELQSEISADIAWRKKEISDLSLICHSSDNPALVRACFVMICAHFEGAIRIASNAYIAYISSQNIKGADLRHEINAIAVRKKKHQLFKHTGSKKVKVSSVSEVLKSYDEIYSGNFYIKLSEDDMMPEIDDDDPALPTEGNPTPDVLKEITQILGLNYDLLFHLRENYINSELLKPRHCVVHGERRNIHSRDLNEAKDFVLRSMDEFSYAIIDAAQNGLHLKPI